MPVPLPETDVNLSPPDRDEVVTTARAIVTVLGGPGGLTALQRHVLDAHFEAMTGVSVDLDQLSPLSPEDFAQAMRRRDHAFRTRIVQVMLLAAFILSPLPPQIVTAISEYARQLCVADDMIQVASRMASGALGLVLADFSRAGYNAEWTPGHAEPLHTSVELTDGWLAVTNDPALTARWADLQSLPPGTLGRRVWEFYQARGFVFPGQPGSAPPLLAQHDWVHVIADYGSTVEAEVEVFGLISRANDDPRAFSLLAMVLGLFETGMLRSGAGLFEYDPRHMSSNVSGMSARLADAMYRGAIVGARFGGRDLLAVDWFELADQPIEDVRRTLGLPPKSQRAIDHGSVGPNEPGGISPFQLAAGQALAERNGIPYDSHGATVATQLLSSDEGSADETSA